MDVKRILAKISRFGKFGEIEKKLYCSEKLDEKEKTFILGVAIILLKHYDKSKNIGLFEYAYNLILRYSNQTGDYKPLYDVSYNYGFYPTIRFINQKSMLKRKTIEAALIDYNIDSYRNESYIETYEQHITRGNVINSESKVVSFVAPTSSGKSSVIFQHIEHNNVAKAVIVVPSKSLISQTYTELRKKCNNRKVITHDSMFHNEERFVGALTQERLLRLMEKNPELQIDCLYVDEAHNVLKNDDRYILLSRVIKLCRQRSMSTKIIYLTPFIRDSRNLLQDNMETIDEQRILLSVKEPNIFEFRPNGDGYIYDRFAKKSHKIRRENDTFSYIFSNTGNKNFFFLASPKKIEEFAEELYAHTPEIESDEVKDLMKLLEELVHPEFRMIRYLSHGIIFLHGKIPEQIKEYLEHEFKVCRDIKYLVANSVIMEGINLPIDTLFILNLWNVKNSGLQNLIGRVNRLNNVFDQEKGSLSMLTPNVHFVSSRYYTRGDKILSFEKKIEKMYDLESDEISNPLLNSYSDEKQDEKTIEYNKKIVEQEHLFFAPPISEDEVLRKKLILGGINRLVEINDDNVKTISRNIENVDFQKDVIDIVYDVFVKDLNVKDDAFRRLRNPAAIRYYKFFIPASHSQDLYTLIQSEVGFHMKKNESGKNYVYVGKTYGEEYGDFEGVNIRGKVYVDLAQKSHEEMVNLLIMKIRMEQEFISFQYNRAVNFLHDDHLIDDSKYNMEVYGTTDKKTIEMINMGVPVGIMKLLDENKQMDHMYFNHYGNLSGDKELLGFKSRLNSYLQYEMDKRFVFE